MIIIFVLLWFSALWGMEKEMPGEEKPLWVPSLLNIAQHAVCSHILDKKITIDDIQQFSPPEQELIHSLITSEPKEVKGINYNLAPVCYLSTITPDHRYMLVTSKQRLLRLDLCTNETILIHVDDSKGYRKERGLSPSGNLAVFLARHKWWIKDILQNKIIEVQSEIVDPFSDACEYIKFIGENDLLITMCKYKDDKFEVFEFESSILSIEKEELKKRGSCKGNWLATLPMTGKYIVFADGAFLRTTPELTIENQTKVKDLKEDLFFYIRLALYEPEMLIAYEQEQEAEESQVDIVSLKDWPAVVIPSAQLRCGKKDVRISALAFAQRGQWLIVGCNGVKDSKLTIWDWQQKQQLYTHAMTPAIGYLSYTDHPTPYPCLFESKGIIYSFDPIKAVVATMLSQAALQQTIATLNDNTLNNNNNSDSNDNNSAPTKPSKMEVDK